MSIDLNPVIIIDDYKQLVEFHQQRSMIRAQMVSDLREEVARLTAENRELREKPAADDGEAGAEAPEGGK